MTADQTRRLTLTGLASAGAILPLGPASVSLAQRAAGGPLPAVTGHLITRWDNDPVTLGSYSFLKRGTGTELRRPLAATEGRLFFAGEATDPTYPATVHGALSSGERAAYAVADLDAKRVAVIGAGMAGLSAARRLAAEGMTPVVFEARPRIGGRIFTNRELGTPIDLGASWINGTSDNPLATFARIAKADLAVTDWDEFPVYAEDGEELDFDEAPQWYQDHSEIELEYGVDRDEIDPGAFEEGSEYYGDDAILPGGYDQLLGLLTGDYDIRLSSPVTGIAHDATGVTVTVGNSSERFDAAIITLPLGALKAGLVAFDPPLSPAKQDAIQRLGMGLLDKIVLRFEEVFWEPEAHIIGPARPGGAAHGVLDEHAALQWRADAGRLQLRQHRPRHRRHGGRRHRRRGPHRAFRGEDLSLSPCRSASRAARYRGRSQ